MAGLDYEWPSADWGSALRDHDFRAGMEVVNLMVGYSHYSSLGNGPAFESAFLSFTQSPEGDSKRLLDELGYDAPRESLVKSL